VRRTTRSTLALTLALLFACFGTALPLGPETAAADEVSVPIELQVDLLERIVRYERTFAAEATPVHVVVVSRASSPESLRVTGQLVAGLRRAGSLGGRPVDAGTLSYTTAAALRAEVGASHARIVYLAAGLGDEIGHITTALSGAGVITVSAVGADVDRGAVVGFELVSARPRIVVNLTRARAEQLQFNAQFLRLARVVE
jgi:hypothetical protein